MQNYVIVLHEKHDKANITIAPILYIRHFFPWKCRHPETFTCVFLWLTALNSALNVSNLNYCLLDIIVNNGFPKHIQLPGISHGVFNDDY